MGGGGGGGVGDDPAGSFAGARKSEQPAATEHGAAACSGGGDSVGFTTPIGDKENDDAELCLNGGENQSWKEPGAVAKRSR